MQPSIGRTVHYVSYGTPSGEYARECRAAIITEVSEPHPHDELGPRVGLCVLNPTGLFLNRNVAYEGGRGQPGAPDCPNGSAHGTPFRYCACGWTEPAHVGGTWHWPERVE